MPRSQGLLGSEHYVEQLTDDEIGDIALYLNFDMIASPNYMFGIYDGDDSGDTAPDGFIPPGRPRSRTSSRRSTTRAACRRRTVSSRVGPTTGPSSRSGSRRAACSRAPRCDKTVAEAALYGGVPGESYDPCYHSFCDNLTGAGQPVALYAALDAEYDLVGNINTFALDVNSDAVAAAIITFAFDTSTVNGERSPGKSHGSGKSLDAMKDRLAS